AGAGPWADHADPHPGLHHAYLTLLPPGRAPGTSPRGRLGCHSRRLRRGDRVSGSGPALQRDGGAEDGRQRDALVRGRAARGSVRGAGPEGGVGRWRGDMSWELVILAVVTVGWLVVRRWVLPRFGVPT